MKITRIVALAIIAGSVGIISGQSALQAQTLKSAGPPAEYPPASYTARQYVDSRGCVYIRAGIDGNVNWVPRVTRSRKQICGYEPTAVAGTTARPVASAAPEQITIDLDLAAQSVNAQAAAISSPAGSVSTAPVLTTPVPTASARARNAAPAAAGQAPVVVTTTKPARSAAPIASLAGASAAGTGSRSAAPSPRPVGGTRAVAAQPAQEQTPPALRAVRAQRVLTPNSRVVPAHVYHQRRLSQGLTPPPGYRVAWDDGRLNIRRAERDLHPRVATNTAEIPAGYVRVERGDNRMNPLRGQGLQSGEVQMATVWQAGVPRRLVSDNTSGQRVRLRNSRHDRFEGDAPGSLALRLSSRSQPGAEPPQPQVSSARYIRAATFADPDQARRAAQSLAAKGLPVRLGSVSRQGQPYKVVLAGPFPDLSSAQSALVKVRAAGHSRARMSK